MNSKAHLSINAMTAAYKYSSVIRDMGLKLVISDKVVVLLFLSPALVLRLLIAWMDLRTLIVTTIPDDAFYYFAIARNIVQGHGVTFDGVNATNGFHPFWLLLLLPFFAIGKGDPELPIHLALSLGAIIDAWTGLIVFVLVNRITHSRAAGLLSAFFYFYNSGVIKESINGLETSLAVLTIAVAFLLFEPIYSQRIKPIARSKWIVWGIALGLAMLARTDTVILVGALLLVLLVTKRNSDDQRGIALCVVCASVMVLPWLIWSFLQFGSLMQSSGVAFPEALRASFYAKYPQSAALDMMTGLEVSQAWIFRFLPFYYFLWSEEYAWIYYVIVAEIIVSLLILRTRYTASWLVRMRILAAPALGLTLTFLLHSFVRWYPRSWYFVPLVFFVAIALGLAAAYLFDSLSIRIKQAPYLVFPVMVLLGLGFARQGIGDWLRYPWQVETFDAVEWMQSNLSQGDRLGSFNAGVLGYLQQNRVVNLDGVVNWSAYSSLRQRELAGFIQDQKLGLVGDFGVEFNLYSVFWGTEIKLVPVKTWRLAPEPGGGSHFTIYEIIVRPPISK